MLSYRIFNFSKAESLLTFLLCVAATLFFFNQVLNGYIISNCVHIYHFEPWYHHKSNLTTGEKANHIFSDSVDGAYGNLTPTNIEHFSIGRYLQAGFIVSTTLEHFYGRYIAQGVIGLFVFILMMFFTFLYLRLIGINWYIAAAVSLGFSFGSTNMHLHFGWAYETCCGIIALYFLERLIQKRSWWDVIWLMLALVNLGGAVIVHIVAFYAFFIAFYFFTRLVTVKNQLRRLLTQFIVASAGSLLLSMDYLWPTLYYYIFDFEKGYRQSYGIRQNISNTLYTFLFANIYGDPQHETNRWFDGTYINTAMFIGSITFLSAISAGIWRCVSKRDFYSIFFVTAAIFGAFYSYNFSFENLEKYIGSLPPFKWVPPLYFKSVYHLIIAILGALGLQHLWEYKSRFKVIGISICCLIMLCIFWHGFEYSIYAIEKNRGISEYLNSYLLKAYLSAVVSILLAAIIGFYSRFNNTNQFLELILGSILIALIAFETKTHIGDWVPYSKSESCYPPTDTTDFLKQHAGTGRIIGLGYAAVPSMINKNSYGVETAAGRMAVKAAYLHLLRLADSHAYKNHPTQYLFKTNTDLLSPVWDLANVSYFVASRNLNLNLILKKYPEGSIIPHIFSDGIILEKNPNSMHAYVMHAADVFETPEAMVNGIKKGHDVRKTIALETNEHRLKQPERNLNSRILSFKKEKNSFYVTVNAKGEGYLLLSELHDKNWQAYIKDSKIPTFRAYHLLLGALIPEGKHEIVFKYKHPHQKLLNLITGLSLIFISLLILLMISSKDKKYTR